MLGQSSRQGELFRPDHLYLDFVGDDSIYALLGEARFKYFRDEDFADLYREGWGRPSVPPSQLCIALLLQTLDRVSDKEAIARSAFDLRWKVALGLELDKKLCAKSTLQMFRAKLILHDRYKTLFDKSVEACRRAGMLKKRKLEVAIDTTPILGRGAVKDTFNLISDQIRRVVTEVARLKEAELDGLVQEQGLGRHFKKSFKGEVELDWGDPEQRRALVGQLVADARVALQLGKAVLGELDAAEHSLRQLDDACSLLTDLLLQDIEDEPEDGQGPKIRQGTTKDRKVSTTDVDMRHGRKSSSKTFNGYKATVVAETDSGVILETDVGPGNQADGEAAADAITKAEKRAKKKAESVIGDTAYGTLDVREEIEKPGRELTAKVPPTPRPTGGFSLDEFKIDKRRGVAICPAGKKSKPRSRTNNPRPGFRYRFSAKDCAACPLKPQCTTAKKGRSIIISEVTEAQQVHRRRQCTKKFKKKYRRRVIIEHRIARLVQLGVRQAKYIGKDKVAFQVSMAATMANLMAALVAISAQLCGLVTAIRPALRFPRAPWLRDRFALRKDRLRSEATAFRAELQADLRIASFRPGF